MTRPKRNDETINLTKQDLLRALAEDDALKKLMQTLLQEVLEAEMDQALLAGKEDEVFPLLEQAANKAIAEDGAEVLILGSTTMHQSHAYLSARLPVPVINPGPLSYKLAESMLALGLRHSRVGYPAPMYPRLDMLHHMFDAAQTWAPKP